MLSCAPSEYTASSARQAHTRHTHRERMAKILLHYFVVGGVGVAAARVPPTRADNVELCAVCTRASRPGPCGVATRRQEWVSRVCGWVTSHT